ncbi:unnamed protein product [Ectocarpus sp. 12 AP-2014]
MTSRESYVPVLRSLCSVTYIDCLFILEPVFTQTMPDAQTCAITLHVQGIYTVLYLLHGGSSILSTMQTAEPATRHSRITPIVRKPGHPIASTTAAPTKQASKTCIFYSFTYRSLQGIEGYSPFLIPL